MLLKMINRAITGSLMIPTEFPEIILMNNSVVSVLKSMKNIIDAIPEDILTGMHK